MPIQIPVANLIAAIKSGHATRAELQAHFACEVSDLTKPLNNLIQRKLGERFLDQGAPAYRLTPKGKKWQPSRLPHGPAAELATEDTDGEDAAPAAISDVIDAASETQCDVQRAPDFARDPELQYLPPEDYEMPPADPSLLALANRSLAEQIDESRSVIDALTERLESYDHAVSGIHHICREAGIEPGLVHERVRALADERDELQRGFSEVTSELGIRAHTIANLECAVSLYKEVTQANASRIQELEAELATERQARAALQEQLDCLPEIRTAAETFIVLAAKRKPARIKCPDRARERALSAVRNGAQRASVYALVHVGDAARGAVFEEAQ